MAGRPLRLVFVISVSLLVLIILATITLAIAFLLDFSYRAIMSIIAGTVITLIFGLIALTIAAIAHFRNL